MTEEKNLQHKIFMKEKFGRITKYYDLANSLCSLLQDRGWRWEVAQCLKDCDAPLLDLCCGPYTLTLEILKPNPRKVFALDLSREMLLFGLTKRNPLLSYVYPLCGDAEILPFKDGTFGGVSIAFGFRNLVNRRKALEEIKRVLKKGGLLAILEFSKPKNFLIKKLYFLYLKTVVPFIGWTLTRDLQAYQYLGASIERFPSQEEVRQMLMEVGFKERLIKEMTLGVVTLYVFSA